MWLLIDDKRDFHCEVIARTAKAGRKMLALGGWECLCLDHDLGCKESGYDICVWALECGFMPKRVQLVTANPVGRENIKKALLADGYKTRDGINFKKS